MNNTVSEEWDDWTEQGMYELAVRSLQYAAQIYGDEDDLVPVIAAEQDMPAAACKD